MAITDSTTELFRHCCDCNRAEDARGMIELAGGYIQDGRPGEAFDAAEALFVTAMKRETAKYATAGLPRFDAR